MSRIEDRGNGFIQLAMKKKNIETGRRVSFISSLILPYKWGSPSCPEATPLSAKNVIS